MGLKTPLYDTHQTLGARLVDFSGWDMPVHYGSQLEEHHAVRQHAGVFDVSHMTVVDISGDQAGAFLNYLLANDARRLSNIGKALYTGMLNFEGGILDDLIVYRTEAGYRAVVNCGTREKDLNWMAEQAKAFECQIEEKPELSIVAIQGPEAIELTRSVVNETVQQVISELKPFNGLFAEDWFVARTGYTGEKGLEIILPADAAVGFWQQLLEVGVRPVGLGARDTLRLEAGMNLYGSDMDESVTPWQSNMATTVVLSEDRDFIGKQALIEQQQAGVPDQLVGLVMTSKGVLRSHYPVLCNGEPVGEITSGIFSPTLGHAVALARVKSTEGDMAVEIRGKAMPVSVVTPPFVRNGKQVYSL